MTARTIVPSQEYNPHLVIPLADKKDLLKQPLISLSPSQRDDIFLMLAQEKIGVEKDMLIHPRGKQRAEEIVLLLQHKMIDDQEFGTFVTEYANFLQTEEIILPFAGIQSEQYRKIYTMVHSDIISRAANYGAVQAHILLTGLESFKTIPDPKISFEDNSDARKLFTQFFRSEQDIHHTAPIKNHNKTLVALAAMTNDYLQWDKWEHIWIVALAGQQLDTHHRSRWTKIADYAEGALLEQSFHQHQTTDEDLGETLERYKSGMRGLLD